MSDIFGKLSRLTGAACLAIGVGSPAFADEADLRVEAVTADNRGFVIVEFNCPISPFAFNSDPVAVTLRGDDGAFLTDDDVDVPATATRVNDNSVLEIRASVPPDEPYRVVLNANVIVSNTGRRLDGEFNGPEMESGDGDAGGDLEFFTRPPAVTIARFTTLDRFIDVELFPGATPLTVQNFLAYANDGDWDGTFIHRALEDFIVQGGGFMANATFDEVDERDPVQNEPGISNLRGTIAMAKLPGDPDSATNQWFFNLDDNSENLDNQNGGFTVFGEVLDTQSLSLVDGIGQRPTVDVSDVDSAFTDVPIMNLADFVERGEMLIPEDVIEIERVAILQDISSEPSVSFNTENADIVQSDSGGAMVMVFDVAGQTIPGGMVEVDFYDNGNSVRSVTLDEGMPANREIAISITSDEPVGTIQDKRRNDPRDIAFIHSNAPIERIKLNSGIAGANINGVRLPDGSTLPVDIDGDGGGADPTAILVQSGSLFRVDIDGDVVGDIVAPVAPFSIKVKGDVRNCSMTFEESDERTGLRVQFDRGENIRIETPGELNNLKATDIRTTDMRTPSRIVAGRINSIKTQGDRRNDIEGDFECDITTTAGADEDTTSALRNLKVKGDIRDSIFDFDTDVFGSIKCDGDIVDCSITIDGTFARGLKVRQLTRTDFDINGQMGNLKAAQIRGGQLVADTVRSVKVKGDRRANLDGDFSMDMLIENPDGDESPIGSIRIDGDLLDSNTTITGSMRSITVKGDVENISWSIEGEIKSIRAGRVRDSVISIEETCRMIRITDWDGGELICEELGLLNVNGDRRNDIPGDLTRLNTTIGVLDRMQLSADGRLFDCEISLFRAGDIRIDGDFVDSEILLNQLDPDNSFEFVVLNSIEVKGSMEGSFLRTRETIRSVDIGRMIDSGIFAGAPSPTVQGFPVSANGLDDNSNLGSVTIRGDDGRAGMINSYVVCSGLGEAFVFQPETNNPVGEFGVSYTNLAGDILVIIDGNRIFLDEREGSFGSGDFQVRSFHQAPELP